MNISDFKEITCPIHGDKMTLVLLHQNLTPIPEQYWEGEYRGPCGCSLHFDTGIAYILKS